MEWERPTRGESRPLRPLTAQVGCKQGRKERKDPSPTLAHTIALGVDAAAELSITFLSLLGSSCPIRLGKRIRVLLDYHALAWLLCSENVAGRDLSEVAAVVAIDDVLERLQDCHASFTRPRSRAPRRCGYCRR
jgi:hypothetical protein